MRIEDVSHTTGKVPTPHLDRMAKEGIRFTDAHTFSSVCTPSRYSLLIGRYNWRTRLARHVFSNPNEKPLIKKVGYHTACIGKWHLGIEWQNKQNYKAQKWQKGKVWNIDYTKAAITPTSNGFNYC